VELDAEKAGVVEVVASLLQVAGQARVRPHEPVDAAALLDHPAHLVVVGVEDDAALDPLLAHQPLQPLAVERDVEEGKVAHVHVGVKDHRNLPVARPSPPVLGSAADC